LWAKGKRVPNAQHSPSHSLVLPIRPIAPQKSFSADPPKSETELDLQDYHTAKYQEINSRFDAVDRRFDTLVANLEHTEQRAVARSRNRFCTRLFHLIQPVKVHGKTPEHFPKGVGAFCKLRRGGNCVTPNLFLFFWGSPAHLAN
jgi:hypothetical protein